MTDWQPHIDHNRCTGCGACVINCHVQALALIEERAMVVAAHRCDYCGDCEWICPTVAIQLPYTITILPNPTQTGTDDVSTHD